MLDVLDQNVSHFADMAEKALGSTFRDTEGAGAAGGLGWSLLTYLQADLKRGIDIVLEAVDFESIVQDADLVITGEDESTAKRFMEKHRSGWPRPLNHTMCPLSALRDQFPETVMPSINTESMRFSASSPEPCH